MCPLGIVPDSLRFPTPSTRRASSSRARSSGAGRHVHSGSRALTALRARSSGVSVAVRIHSSAGVEREPEHAPSLDVFVAEPRCLTSHLWQVSKHGGEVDHVPEASFSRDHAWRFAAWTLTPATRYLRATFSFEVPWNGSNRSRI